MLKVLVAFAVLIALAVAVAFVPLRGRTVLDRWRAARTPSEFVERAYREATVAFGPEPQRPRNPRGTAQRPTRPTAPAAHPPLPAERYSDKDRAALDRIIEERATEHPRR